MTLLAGPSKEKVRCHKFILASRSPVFYTMFCGSLPETAGVVEIPDIEATVLKQVVRFLYSGEVTLAADSVMSLLFAAKKYDVVNLKDKCTAFLNDNISTENVCIILGQALQFDEEQLGEQCLEFIAENATVVLESEDFCRLSKQAVRLIVGLKHLKCDELFIYESCKRWAKAICHSNGLEETDLNIREAFGDIIYLIGFHSMHVKEFCENVTNDNILTKSEIVDIYRNILSKSVTTKFSTVCREKFEPFTAQRATSVNTGWSHGGKQDGISFQVSKPVKLVSITCYLPCEIGKLEGPLKVYEESSLMLNQPVCLAYKSGLQYEKVTLINKLCLVPGKRYSICQILRGASSFCMRKTNREATCSVSNVTIKFMDLIKEVGSSENGTKISCGQFHAITLQP